MTWLREALSDVFTWNDLSQANEIQVHNKLLEYSDLFFLMMFSKLIKLK